MNMCFGICRCSLFFFFAIYIMFSSQLVSCARQRKDELEQRMSTLQESRRELMVQLEQLMMLLKVLQMCFSSIWEQHAAQMQHIVYMSSWSLKGLAFSIIIRAVINILILFQFASWTQLILSQFKSRHLQYKKHGFLHCDWCVLLAACCFVCYQMRNFPCFPSVCIKANADFCSVQMSVITRHPHVQIYFQLMHFSYLI